MELVVSWNITIYLIIPKVIVAVLTLLLIYLLLLLLLLQKWPK